MRHFTLKDSVRMKTEALDECRHPHATDTKMDFSEAPAFDSMYPGNRSLDLITDVRCIAITV
jgi:hypothetical protein